MNDDAADHLLQLVECLRLDGFDDRTVEDQVGMSLVRKIGNI
jgi:hypothetical protein